MSGDVAVDILHFDLDASQLLGAFEQSLGMLGDVGVGQRVLVPQLVFQARPVIHGDSAELNLDRRHMWTIGEENGNSINNVQTAVSVGFWILDVILDSENAHIGLLREELRNLIHIINIVADDSNSCDVTNVIFDAFDAQGRDLR